MARLKNVLPSSVSVYTFSNPESFKTLTLSLPHSNDIKTCFHINISDSFDTNLKSKSMTSISSRSLGWEETVPDLY